jgi:predicted alpha/beta hydrolase
MSDDIQHRTLHVDGSDGARARVQLVHPLRPSRLLYWLPALGVGLGPNLGFAEALARQGVAVAVHEWRGLGESNRRASRACDWGYRELLDLDLPTGLRAVRDVFDGLPVCLGGHSLGGQFALIHAARQPQAHPEVWLVASGQPHWRAFGGLRALGVLAFACAIPGITRLAGYFPGTRLGFAGREAGRMMRDWAGTAIRGDYAMRAFGSELDLALKSYAGRVLALRMREDGLAPPRAIDRLRQLAPQASWTVRDLGREAFAARRPDHFGWLREPVAVVDAFMAWNQAKTRPAA